MLIDTTAARLPLLPGQMARLALTPRARLLGLSGQAWLTLDHDTRDIVLGPGDEFVASRAGQATVGALRRDGHAEVMVQS